MIEKSLQAARQKTENKTGVWGILHRSADDPDCLDRPISKLQFYNSAYKYRISVQVPQQKGDRKEDSREQFLCYHPQLLTMELVGMRFNSTTIKVS